MNKFFHYTMLSFLGIHSGEGMLVLNVLAYAIFVFMAEALAYTSGYALFLSQFDAQMLPYIYVSISIFAPTISFIYIKCSERIALSNIIGCGLGLLTLSLGSYCVGLMFTTIKWLTFTLPIWLGILHTLNYTIFWSMLGRLFDSHASKRLFGLLGSGKDIGLALTGLCTPLLLQWFETISLLWIASLTFCIAFGIYLYIRHTYAALFKADKDEIQFYVPKTAQQGNNYLWQDRYVLLITAMYTLWVLSNSFIDNIFYTQVQFIYLTDEELANFIGVFYGGSSVFGLVIQIFITSRVFKRRPISKVLPFTPILLATCTFVFIVGVHFSGHALIVKIPLLINFLLNVLDGIDTPTLNILYQSLSLPQRTRVQTTLDGILYPLGMGIASGVLLLLINLWQFTVLNLSCVLFAILVGWAGAAILTGHLYTNKTQNSN